MAGEASGAASCLVREVVVQVRRGGVAGEADGGGTARGGRRVRRAARRRERRAARRGEGGTAGGAVVWGRSLAILGARNPFFRCVQD